MTVCTDQPPQGFVGTFLCGQRLVGSVRYQDATCGIPTCGYAICAKWWAYLCPTGLALGGERPSVITGTPVLEPAGLQLQSRVPALVISQAFVVPPAGLALGGYVPTFAGQTWLSDLDCTDLDLDAAPTSELVLTATGVTTIDLEAEVCR